MGAGSRQARVRHASGSWRLSTVQTQTDHCPALSTKLSVAMHTVANMSRTMHPVAGHARTRGARAVMTAVMASGCCVVLLSGCGLDVLARNDAGETQMVSRSALQVGEGLPENWPQQVPVIPGFEVQYATVDESLQGRSMLVQFYSEVPRWGATADYVEALRLGGFDLLEQEPAAGWWRLKGYGMTVEVVTDVSLTDEMRVAVIVTH